MRVAAAGMADGASTLIVAPSRALRKTASTGWRYARTIAAERSSSGVENAKLWPTRADRIHRGLGEVPCS
jgi:hypothetical protein